MSVKESIKDLLDKASVQGILALIIGASAAIGFLAGLIGHGILSEDNFMIIATAIISFLFGRAVANGNGGTQ